MFKNVIFFFNHFNPFRVYGTITGIRLFLSFLQLKLKKKRKIFNNFVINLIRQSLAPPLFSFDPQTPFYVLFALTLIKNTYKEKKRKRERERVCMKIKINLK